MGVNILKLLSNKQLSQPTERGEPSLVIDGDAVFPLKNCLLGPFSGKDLQDKQIVFNYSLSRTQQIMGNTFGILAHR